MTHSLTPVAAPAPAVPRYASLVDLATNDLLVTYAVSVRRPRGRVTHFGIITVEGALERGYGGPKAPDVAEPAWFLHADAKHWSPEDRITHQASLDLLDEHWQADKDDDEYDDEYDDDADRDDDAWDDEEEDEDLDDDEDDDFADLDDLEDDDEHAAW